MLTKIRTPHIERDVCIREETSDFQVWADTFSGLYHLPPDEMPTPATVLDLGANIGLTAAHYRYLWPQAHIVAVEMDAGNYELACKNAPGVLHRQTAVASVPGTGFYDGDSAFGYALREAGTAVNCRTLAEIIESEFGGSVDFVKMDIEGEEWNLFKTPLEWAPLVRHLVVELHERSRNQRGRLVERAIGKLEAAGFGVRAHPPHPTAVYAWR